MRLLVDSLRTRCYGAMKEGRCWWGGRGEGGTEDEVYVLGRKIEREREREKDGELIREGAEWEGERFYTGYPLEGSGARDSHRHARAACRYKRRRSYY